MKVLLALAFMASTSLADEETVLTGTVTTALRARPKRLLEIEGDAKCNCLHEKTPKDESLAISPDGGVKWALVRITKGLEGKAFTPPKQAARLDQKGCLYAPRVVGLMTGQPIEITNSDDLLHNIHGLSFEKEFNRAQLLGARDTFMFAKPEIFKIKCEIHPWMAAHIGVFDHPYFAVTDEAGRFTIKGLPAGTYTLEAWHEQLKGTPAVVVVAGKETKADVVLK
jgi:plastocyanin